jgi:HSP20 family protein
MAIVRWDPFQEMMSLQERFNRLLGTAGGERVWMPAIDITDTPEALMIRAELAGMRPEDVRVEIDDNALTISGERRQEEERKQDRYRSVEWRYGSFERTFPLPQGAKTDEVKATLEDGVLEVRVPKAERAKPKSVQVESKAGSKKAIGAEKAA